MCLNNSGDLDVGDAEDEDLNELVQDGPIADTVPMTPPGEIIPDEDQRSEISSEGLMMVDGTSDTSVPKVTYVSWSIL